MSTESMENPVFEKLLGYLKRNRGFDFTGYKRASLERRVLQRMQAVGVVDFESYIDYLQVDPNEYVHLFNTILINVTAFLRDTQAWEYLHNIILPKIIEQKLEDEPIRVWAAGSASGEEAYSIAMLLNEHLGTEAFKQRVKIYATDMDEDALARAHTACYTAKDVAIVPENLRDKYFEVMGGRYYFQKDLRRLVIFGRHDLIQDAPISRVDLLICRNVLMYFNLDTQARVLSRMHFALRDQGYLFLGKAEMLLTHSNLFMPVDLKHRVFSKVTRNSGRDRVLPMSIHRKDIEPDNFIYVLPKIREAAMDANPIAQILIDTNGTLVLANAHARSLFALSTNDIGRPIQDLKLSYQPVDLRSLIDQARNIKEPKLLKGMPWSDDGPNERFFDISVAALFTEQGRHVGVSLSFMNVSEQKRLQKQLEHINQERETAMEELESTNEELETTNEELQSTIEELETTNEELQATNEELETLNTELSVRTGEINEVNAHLNSILSSLAGSVMVVNRDYLVEVWNTKSEDLWGLRKEEVLGQSFFSLDIGLPVEQMKRPIREVISGENMNGVFEMNAKNRLGQNVHLRCSVTPLFNREHEIDGVILILEQAGHYSEEQ